MTGCCCAPSGYDEFFGEKQARKDARHYRKKGLHAPARWIVDMVRSRGLEGATVLEPGGGVGAIQLELLKAGASRATVVELSPGYEEEAVALAREAGLEERIERHLGDFAADGVADADVVVLHRVVCCYPDYERLLGAAAQRARRLLVFSYPPRNLVSRPFIGLANLTFRLLGREYRSFAHPPSAMLGLLGERGLRRTFAHHAPVWRVAGLER